MNIAICDDEKYVRSYIRKLIEKQEKDCQIFEFSSGEALLKFQKEGKETFDMLFLDISIQDENGMDVAKQLRENQGRSGWGNLPLLIFVTGYPEYMPEAFSVNAFQFLIKPVKEEEFERVFTQASRECRSFLAKQRASSKELLIRSGKSTRKIQEHEIYYVESSSRKVILCLADEKISYYDKISALEEKLREHFFRVHKGYLINMRHVERYSRTEVKMRNGDSLLISKYKYQDFVKAYLSYIRREMMPAADSRKQQMDTGDFLDLEEK